jgi:hypothetical protein
MSSLKPRVEAGFRRLERKLGIDREGRTVWVWLLPPAIGLLTGFLVPFMPGLPDSMGLADRITLSIFAFFTMTVIASIYLISFDNDHNQQAPVDGPEQARGDDRGPGMPPAPSGPPPPEWIQRLADVSSGADDERREHAGDPERPRVPVGSGADR